MSTTETGHNIIDIDIDGCAQEIYEPEELLEPADALMRCLDECGAVDIRRISELCGSGAKDCISALSGAVIREPENWNGEYCDGFVLRENYLSGNLGEKLRTAKAANDVHNGIFEENIEAIRAAMPGVREERELRVTLGAPWVPPGVIDDFIVFLLDERATDEPMTKYDAVSNTWTVSGKAYYESNVRNTSAYGTEKMTALQIIESTLNVRTIEIKKKAMSWENKKEKVDREETELVLEKQRLIVEQFDEWIFSDPKRARMLEELYDSIFGSIRVRSYDGRFLTFPGMNKDVTMRTHQRGAVARIVFNDDTLLAHDVGAGKTYTMIAAGQEIRRMGLSEKNMYVVPNAILAQWEADYRYLYPDAHIIVVSPRTFEKKKRAGMLLRMKYEPCDAILIAASCFALIPLSLECRIEDLVRERTELVQAISGENVRRTLVVRQIDKLNERINELREEMELNRMLGIDEGICFDRLGVTTLFVDEAHEYKNITVKSKTRTVFGMMKKGSAKCDSMLAKVHFVQRTGRGAVFATATPISNSITDVFVMQTYLEQGMLRFLDLASFDNWSTTFARRTSSLELDVDGRSLKTVTRLAHFYNLPELSSLYTQVADFYIEDAQHVDYTTEDITVPCSAPLRVFFSELSQRADAVHSGKVDRREDNLLKITADGRKGTLDLRMFDGYYCDYTQTKTYACECKVYEIWKDTRDERLTQIIFCDLSTPKKEFNVYDEIRFRLTMMGVPASQIAFIHEAETESAKRAMFEMVNRGDIRILIGSTQKLGTGVNVQKRLCAVHHLDVPWKPSDITQREGRMLRQGNECAHTAVYRYVCEGSFDAYSWQLLEIKQEFISQFMTNTLSAGCECNFEELALSFAEIKALAVGDPTVRQRIETQNRLNRTLSLHRSFVAQHRRLSEELAQLPDKIERQHKHALDLSEDASIVSDQPAIDKADRRALGEEILEALSGNVMQEEERLFDYFLGLELYLPANMLEQEPRMILRGYAKYVVPMGADVLGNVRRLENAAHAIAQKADKAFDVLETMTAHMQDIKDELAKENPYELTVYELRMELDRIDEMLERDKAAV